MTGFGSTSFGGFGSNNQGQQQNTGFGSTGFGGTSGAGGFGSTASPFGGTANSGNAFGSTSSFGGGSGGGGAFGSGTPQTSVFGQSTSNRPFGASTTTSTGAFGANNQTTGFGSTGFGSGAATGTGTGGGFGSTLGSGSTPGMFGAAKSGFGSSGAGNNIFGGGTTSSPAASTGTGFGGASGTGFGANNTTVSGNVPTPEGTANPPFRVHTEKDTSGTSHYQSIPFIDPYQKFSFEELRMADYNHGRRYSNASGQPGAFGAFSGFGGSGFGSTTATSAPFGSATPATGGFGAQTQTSAFGGSTSTNPLFGATKPSTGLTGQPSAFGASGTTGGFGTSSGNAFGSSSTGSNGIFGSNQQKPGFGSTTSTPALGTGFGAQATTNSSALGGTTATTSLFGQQQGTQSNAFGGFGQNQTQNKPAFGGFGQNQPQQQQAGGIFGNTGNTGTSNVFGNNQAQQGTSMFGQQNQQPNASTGIFGNSQQNNQQQKPGGLFGGFGQTNTGSGTNSLGSLGGGQVQQTIPSLFGNQQQKPGGLFGNSTGQTGGLFGSLNTTPAANSSMFGSGGLNQGSQQGTQGAGMFGQSIQQNQQPQQQQAQNNGFQASLLDGNPYGSQSIFSGLPAPNTQSPGPLATPLSASMKQKQRTPLPMYKISPNAANRLVTPPTRQGYGFSYSTYGTPNSAGNTPGSGGLFSGSLRGGSLGRSFGKSLSSSSLRKTWDPESDSILAPGAFSAGGSRHTNGSLKRLTIDRSLRTDLFSRASPTPPALTNGEDGKLSSSKLKKKVSFTDPATSVNQSSSALVLVDDGNVQPTAEELGFLRSSRNNNTANQAVIANNSTASDSSVTDAGSPQMEQIRGNGLTPVPENDAYPGQLNNSVTVPTGDPNPGDYWMRPPRDEISRMTREQQKRVTGFTVGRSQCGSVTFNDPVDLTTINLDRLYGDIIKIGIRKITVYSDEDIAKPPPGKGLNVPSTLRIENSWPRGRNKAVPSPFTSGPTFERHLRRLKDIGDCEFVDYEKETGTWVFNVPHFTTYGLNYDDDEDDVEGESFNQSNLNVPPDSVASKDLTTPTQSALVRNTDSAMSVDDSVFGDSVSGIEDDTFEFKKKKAVPGSFLNRGLNGVQDELESDDDRNSFLDESSAGSSSDASEEDLSSLEDASAASEVESDGDEEMRLAGSFPIPDQTVELSKTVGSQAQPNTFGLAHLNESPANVRLDLSGNWARQLQRTISPRKQDREALREVQEKVFQVVDEEDTPTKPKQKSQQPQFATSIDLMNSLFGQAQRHGTTPNNMNGAKAKNGLKWPYPKNPKTFAGKFDEMSEVDMMFHKSTKPRWGPSDEIVIPALTDSNSDGDAEDNSMNRSSVHFLRVLGEDFGKDLNGIMLQRHGSTISNVDNVPFSRLTSTNSKALAESVTGNTTEADNERWMWQLSEILFNGDFRDDISDGVPSDVRDQFKHRIKKDRFNRLWETLIRHRHSGDIEEAKTPVERAVLYLASHRVDEACKALVDCGNPHLATLVSQIGRDSATRSAMREQIDSWRKANVLSEMSEPIRAIYELLSGNCLRSEGILTGPPEDRLSAFNISELFELDWFQAFGLRLWYGISEDDPLESAVSQFYFDVHHKGEPRRPVADCFRDFDNHESDDLLGFESPLWVLLKVFKIMATEEDQSQIESVALPQAITPKAVSGNCLRNRVSFQLFHYLTKTAGNSKAVTIDTTRADQLTYDYASELATGCQYAPSIFVLLHLSHPSDRERNIKEFLSRFAMLLPDNENEDVWTYLLDLQIPPSWIWIAKALYARCSGDITSQVEFLIRGKHWNDAHDTFIHVVGPRTIIERDYTTLNLLIEGFGENPDRKVRGWAEGGAIYQDFLYLATTKGGFRDSSRLKRLLSTLANLGSKVEKSASSSLEERVAFREMSFMAAGWASKDASSSIEVSTVLNLPLTQNARSIHAAEISRKYYNSIMAGGSG